MISNIVKRTSKVCWNRLDCEMAGLFCWTTGGTPERETKTDGLFCIDHRTEDVVFQSGIIGIKKGRYCARMIWKIKVLWAIAHRTFIFHIILAQYRPFFIPIIPLWNTTSSVLWSMQNKPSVFVSLSGVPPVVQQNSPAISQSNLFQHTLLVLLTMFDIIRN